MNNAKRICDMKRVSKDNPQYLELLDAIEKLKEGIEIEKIHNRLVKDADVILDVIE